MTANGTMAVEISTAFPISITLSTDLIDGIRVINVGGEVDVYTAQSLIELIQQEIADGQHRLILDLSGIDFIDVHGLGTITGIYKRLQEHNGQLRLAGITPRLQRIFEVIGLDKIFVCLPDVHAAASHLLAN